MGIQPITNSFLVSYILSNSLKLRQAAVPTKFFDPLTSPIFDSELGSLTEFYNNFNKSDVSVTMYYAPWDGESILFRREFEIVAKHFADQVISFMLIYKDMQLCSRLLHFRHQDCSLQYSPLQLS